MRGARQILLVSLMPIFESSLTTSWPPETWSAYAPTLISVNDSCLPAQFWKMPFAPRLKPAFSRIEMAFAGS